jgi:hypothetical protein
MRSIHVAMIAPAAKPQKSDQTAPTQRGEVNDVHD